MLAAFLLLVDQATKWWVQHALPLGRPVAVWAPWLYFTHVQNPGAAFSLFANQRPLLIAVAVAVGALAWRQRGFIAEQSGLFRYGLAIGLTGAAGNLIDRLRLGRVVDFVDLRIWPVFNVADSCIVLGVGMVMLSILANREGGSNG